MKIWKVEYYTDYGSRVVYYYDHSGEYNMYDIAEQVSVEEDINRSLIKSVTETTKMYRVLGPQ